MADRNTYPDDQHANDETAPSGKRKLTRHAAPPTSGENRTIHPRRPLPAVVEKDDEKNESETES